MSDKNKTEVNEESLKEVAGGGTLFADGTYGGGRTFSGDPIVEGGGELVVDSGAGSKGSAGGGSGITNTNSSSTQKIGQQGDKNSNSGSINM